MEPFPTPPIHYLMDVSKAYSQFGSSILLPPPRPSQSVPDQTDCHTDKEVLPKGRHSKRQLDWIKKCVSNFSLYAHLLGTNVEDPYEEAASLQAAIESGQFKQKISKSAKKRLRRQKNKKKSSASNPHGIRSSQMKKISLALAKKQTKKDMKHVIDKLSKI